MKKEFDTSPGVAQVGVMTTQEQIEKTQSLDMFQSWEQYRNVRVKGYTLRDWTSVLTLTFPPEDRKPSDKQISTIAELLADGWVISAIHFE